MEKNIIGVRVVGRSITVGAHKAPTAGNRQHDVLKIETDKEWNGLDLRVTLYSGKLGFTVEWDGESEIEIPWELTAQRCEIAITVAGSLDGTDRLVTYAMPAKDRIRVNTNGEDEGIEPSAPTEDIIVQAVKAADRANEVSERVEGAEDERQQAFEDAQTKRDGDFQQAQGERTEAFGADMATWAQDVASKVAEATTAAQAANNAANNISQRADSGEFNGAPFSISYTPTSIAALNAIQGAKQGEFAVINSSVEDPDNSKLFMFGNGTWNYMSDLSGATGFGLQGKQGVSLRGVRVINATQVEVTQYDPMTEQERTYVIGDFAAPLAAGINAAVDAKLWTGTQAQYDAIATKNPNTWYGVVD